MIGSTFQPLSAFDVFVLGGDLNLWLEHSVHGNSATFLHLENRLMAM